MRATFVIMSPVGELLGTLGHQGGRGFPWSYQAGGPMELWDGGPVELPGGELPGQGSGRVTGMEVPQGYGDMGLAGFREDQEK